MKVRSVLRRTSPPLAVLVLVHVASAQAPIPLVQEGDPISGVGRVTRVDNLTVNDDGTWIVEADTDHADGNLDSVLIRSGILFLREGDALPAPPGAQIDYFDSINLAAGGHSGWNFFLDGTSGSNDDSGLYYDTNLLIQESDLSTAAGFSPGTPYIGFLEAKLDEYGRMLVVASVDDPAIASSVDRALVILHLDGTGNLLSEEVVAKEGDLLPGQANPVADFETAPHEFALNHLGDVLFAADLEGPTDFDGTVYLNDVLLAQEGNPSPASGRNWFGLSSVECDLNDNRDYVISGLLDGDTATNLLIEKTGTVFRQKGDTLPAISPHVITAFGTGPVQIANDGAVLWYATWSDPDPDVDSGLFVDDDLLVQEGVTTVGLTVIDTIYGVQDGYAVSPNGRYVVFEAELDDGTNGAYLIDRGTRASTALRNGAGGNELLYSSTTPPVLGTTWTAEVDHSAHGGATTLIFGYAGPVEGVLLPPGELLIDPTAGWLFTSIALSSSVHTNPVPGDVSFAGVKAFSQGLLLAGPPVLTNAVDLVLGH